MFKVLKLKKFIKELKPNIENTKHYEQIILLLLVLFATSMLSYKYTIWNILLGIVSFYLGYGIYLKNNLSKIDNLYKFLSSSFVAFGIINIIYTILIFLNAISNKHYILNENIKLGLFILLSMYIYKNKETSINNIIKVAKYLSKVAIFSLIIVFLLVLSDYLYHLYNHNYTIHPKLKIIKELWFILFGILLIKNKVIKYSLLGFIATVEMVEYLHFQYFGAPIQPVEFYQMYINTGEVFLSFFDAYKKMIIPFVISVVIFILTVKIAKRIAVQKFKYRKLLIILLILLPLANDFKITKKGLLSKSGKLLHRQAKKILPIPGHLSIENFSRATKYFTLAILPKKIFSNNQILNFNSLKAPIIKNKNQDINIVFVIGESLRAKSFALVNNEINYTTPNLMQIKNIFAKKVISGGLNTKTSVSAIVNRVKYPGATAQMATQNNNLFKLAKENGFKTYFISAQKDYQLEILDNYIGKKYIDKYLSRTILKDKNHSLSPYDDILLDPLKKIDFNKGHNFVVMQKRGSHSPYKKQYPKEFAKFKEPYLNTVYYTDKVLANMIKYLKKHSTKPTYFIFSSDHGELQGEHGGKYGHPWFYKECYQVPFLFYAINSDKNLIKDLNNIQCHFDVSNLVVKLLGYDVKIEHLEDIYVNGSDIDALAGYLHIKVDKNNSIISVKKILP